MRHRLALFLPLFALAACGRPSLEKDDGSFDRARYREIGTRECADGMRRTNPSVPEQEATRLCGCIMERMIAASSDEELRVYYRDDQVPTVKMQRATLQCGGPQLPGVPVPPDVEEPPPPDEPPPSLSDGTPPPVVAPAPGDGPDAGGGASVPGGARARARANLASYLSPDDYPAAALRNNQQGSVTFILDIGPDGRVTGCSIAESSGSAALDSATCRIMRSRARYTPARNARGVAVADRTTARVTWALPAG